MDMEDRVCGWLSKMAARWPAAAAALAPIGELLSAAGGGGALCGGSESHSGPLAAAGSGPGFEGPGPGPGPGRARHRVRYFGLHALEVVAVLLGGVCTAFSVCLGPCFFSAARRRSHARTDAGAAASRPA